MDPYTFTKNSAISPITPTSLGGSVVTWSVAPALPNGLTIDSSTGTISGTPTTITSSSTYVITAVNSGGSDTVSIVIQVNDIIPSISYSGTPFTLTKDTTMSPAAPTNTGGTVVSWSVNRPTSRINSEYNNWCDYWNSNCCHIFCTYTISYQYWWYRFNNCGNNCQRRCSKHYCLLTKYTPLD